MGAARAEGVREMFGRIVPRYDLLNRLMSFGMDRRWRRNAAAAAEPDSPMANPPMRITSVEMQAMPNTVSSVRVRRRQRLRSA